MKLGIGSLLTLAFSLTMIHAALASAPVETSPITVLSKLQPGQWIQLEGITQKESGLLCTKMKLVTTDLDKMDWSVRGSVRDLDPTKAAFSIGRYRVRASGSPRYNGIPGAFRGFSDLKPGMIVKVEGSYIGGGAFQATKVNDESSELSKKPGIEQKIRLCGKIESVNPAKRSIALMGTTFLVNEKTQVRKKGTSESESD